MNRDTSPNRKVLLSPSVTLAILNAALPAEHAVAGVAVAVQIIGSGRVGGATLPQLKLMFSLRPRFVAYELWTYGIYPGGILGEGRSDGQLYAFTWVCSAVMLR